MLTCSNLSEENALQIKTDPNLQKRRRRRKNNHRTGNMFFTKYEDLLLQIYICLKENENIFDS